MFAIVSFASIALAQQQTPLSYDAISKAKQGAWAEYSVAVRGQQQTAKMRQASVAKSAKNLQFEITSATPMGLMVMSSTYEPAGSDWKLTKVHVQMGTMQQDIPNDQLKSGDIKKDESPGKLIGTESLTTPAGKFSCKHYQRAMTPNKAGGETVDLWMSDQVSPTGLVKMTSTKAEISLMATGGDAKPYAAPGKK
jgi:hypothetical protein